MKEKYQEERQKDREKLLSILKNLEFEFGGDEPPEIEFYFGKDIFSIPANYYNREILTRNQELLLSRSVSWRIIEG